MTSAKMLSAEMHRAVRWTARLGLVTALTFITYIALVPSPDVPFEFWDKANHFIAFFTLTLLADYAFPGMTWKKPAFVYLFLYGLSLELIQWRTGYRVLEYWDVVANTVGMATFLAIRPVISASAAIRQLQLPFP